MFLGLDSHERPVYVPMGDWLESHTAFVGTSGFGKTVMASAILAQSIYHGHGCWVLDSKGDKWLPCVMQTMCERYGRPFWFIDMNEPVEQLCLLGGIRNQRELEILFFETFELARKFDQYDYFRLCERWAASAIADVAAPTRCSVADLSRDCDAVLKRASIDIDRAQGLRLGLAELARVTAICTSSVNKTWLTDPLVGGCLYIRGSLYHDNIKAVMRMVLLRLMQIAETKPPGSKHMTVFADDFKFCCGTNAVNGLETVRQHDCNLLLGFTAFDDLAEHRHAVMNNCAIQAMFRATSPEMAEWMSRRSGTVLKRERHLDLERNLAGYEIQPTAHREREVVMPCLEVNQCYALPKFTAAVYGLGPMPKIVRTCPMEVGPQREMRVIVGPPTKLAPVSLLPPKNPKPLPA